MSVIYKWIRCKKYIYTNNINWSVFTGIIKHVIGVLYKFKASLSSEINLFIPWFWVAATTQLRISLTTCRLKIKQFMIG